MNKKRDFKILTFFAFEVKNCFKLKGNLEKKIDYE